MGADAHDGGEPPGNVAPRSHLTGTTRVPPTMDIAATSDDAAQRSEHQAPHERHPSALTLDGRERERRVTDIEVLRWRTLASLILGSAIMVMPLFGDIRLQIGAAVVVFGCAANLWFSHKVAKGHPVPRLVAASDALAAVLIALLVPDSFGIVVVVLVSATGLYVFWYGPRTTVRLLPLAGVGLLAVGLLLSPELWVAYLIAWLVACTFATIIFGHIARALTAQRDRYDELINGIDAAVWEGDGPSGPADYVSDNVGELLGFDPAEMRRSDFLLDRVHPDDRAVVVEGERLAADGQDVEMHFRVMDAWGRTRRFQNRVRTTVDHSGRVVRRRGVYVDETARWEAEESVRRYTDFVEGIPIALVVIRMEDPDDSASFVLQAANPAAVALAQLDDQAIGLRIVDLIPVTDEFVQDMVDVVRTGEPHDEPFVRIRGVDEVFSIRAVPLPDRCVGISLEDVTKRARMAEAFRHQATHDALTGLANRALLHERLEHALTESRRTGAPVALLMVDLDRFKDVNDALGHEYGDALLRELSRRMSNQLRDCDTVARLGGDEFAILMTTDVTHAGAEEVARRLSDLATTPVQVGQYRLQVSASIGIAVSPEHGDDADTLMRRSDGAMYDAKQAGGGHELYRPEQEVAAVRRLELLAELREEGFTDEVEVHFQPRVDLATMSIFGVEALVRWRHPRHGLLPPSEFIELAEVSGAIRAITQAVTLQACAALEALTGHGLSSANVNLSVRNLYDPVWVDWLCDLATTSDMAPGTLWLELTEAQLMDDPRQSAEVIGRLHDHGLRFSIDDFGSGASSLAVIRDLPVDEVKVDRRFVDELLVGDERIVRSIVEVAHHLGLSVTAEGVGDAASIERLRAIGCNSAQGFALAPPMPLNELIEHLERMPTDVPSTWSPVIADG